MPLLLPINDTDWSDILQLYEVLMQFTSSRVAKLNRVAALSKVKGSSIALKELKQLQGENPLHSNYPAHAIKAELLIGMEENRKANLELQMAIALMHNVQEKNYLIGKIDKLIA